jgi:hypothetical protein
VEIIVVSRLEGYRTAPKAHCRIDPAIRADAGRARHDRPSVA